MTHIKKQYQSGELFALLDKTQVIDFRYVGLMVRYHRKKSGLSQIELAKLAGVGKTAVFDIEKGKPTVQLDTFSKVLRVMNITIFFWSPLMETYVTKTNHAKS